MYCCLQEYSGLEVLTEHLETLREASCYGNQNAAYMLAVILNDGLGVKVQQIEVNDPLNPLYTNFCKEQKDIFSLLRPGTNNPVVFEPGLIAYSESRASALTDSAKGSDPLARG